ncbi:MAG: cyclic nucleotide-binding domain-containing protein [Deltaproteobacteria bacterium]|nr:cyclic nucleotide-binding domain-containing protein [Deltaproteobacteria bacterium]
MLKLWDVRPGEWKRALLACCMLMLVVGAYTVVKSVRDAIFLSRFSVTSLSFIAMGLALVTTFIVSLYLRATRGLSRTTLIGGTNLLVAASLVVIWFGLGAPSLSALLPWVLYIWSSIFGVFLVMQFWLLASDLFDAREAKRLFGLVGAGAILGGVAGGLLSQRLADHMGSRGLLLVAAGMLLLEALLARLVWPMRRAEELPSGQRKGRDEEPSTGGFKTLVDNPYVGLLALMLLFSTIATTLLDWQFKGIVQARFAGDADAMTRYFGSLYAILSGISFGLQLLLTGFVLRRFGVRWGLLLLPLSVMAGSALILVHPLVPGLSRLFAASSAKVAEGGLRFAIDKASFELMWMPVSRHIKEQGKAFVDTVMDRLGTGITGLIWLLLASFGLSAPSRIHLVSIAVLILVLLWVAILLRARLAYVNAFRGMLARRELSLEGLGDSLLDADARRTVTQALQSDDARQLSFALYLLDHGWTGALPNLERPLSHGNEPLAVQTLELLTMHKDEAHREAAVGCLISPSSPVRRATIIYLRVTAPSGEDPLVSKLARAAQRDTQLDATTIQLIQLGIPHDAEDAASAIEEALDLLPLQSRLKLVRQLGAAPTAMAARLLRPALDGHEAELVNAALAAMGDSHAETLIPQAIELLSRCGCRPAAMDALRSFGSAAVPALLTKLAYQGADDATRSAIIRVLGASRDASAGAPLMDFAREVPQLRGPTLRALVRLRGHVTLKLDAKPLEDLLDKELIEAYRALLYLRLGSWSSARRSPRPDDLLARTLKESVEQHMGHVFRLLSLRYDLNDIRDAHRGLRSPHRAIRASGSEFLDNLLPPELKSRFLPLVEDNSAEHLREAARRWPGLGNESTADLLRRLLVGPDLALRAMAAHQAGEKNLPQLANALRAARDISPPWVAAGCKRALSQVGDPDPEELPMGLTAIEKALVLQSVDVLQRASTEDLAYVAQISEEIEMGANGVAYNEGDTPDALYVVLKGSVKLHRGDEEIATLGAGEAFGSWALVDEAPRVASATTLEPSTLLKVDREEFVELLADRANIVQAIFKEMVERLRLLADIAKGV